MAFWHEFPFDLCYFAAPPFCDARCRLLRRLVAFNLPKSHQILKIFTAFFLFYLGCFFLSVIIWVGSWTKARYEYAVSFSLAGSFGQIFFNYFYKMNFVKKKLKLFVVEWLKLFTGKFFDFLIVGVRKLPRNFHQKKSILSNFSAFISLLHKFI